MIIGQPVRRVADLEPLTRYMQGIEPALHMEEAIYDHELGAYRVMFTIGPDLMRLSVHVMPSPEWVRITLARYQAQRASGRGEGEPAKLESEG